MVSKMQQTERNLHHSRTVENIDRSKSCHSISDRGGRNTMKSPGAPLAVKTTMIASASRITLGSKVILVKKKKRKEKGALAAVYHLPQVNQITCSDLEAAERSKSLSLRT